MLLTLTVSEILSFVTPNDTVTGETMAWSDIVEWKSDSNNFDGLALAILEQGFSPAAPILLRHTDAGLRLIDGHHRASIAILLGLDSVPVYIAGLDTGGMNGATADFGPRPAVMAR